VRDHLSRGDVGSDDAVRVEQEPKIAKPKT
jgi:hypothetical protein